MSDANVRGMDELLRTLDVLPDRIQKNVVTGATRAAAASLTKEVKLQAPKDQGAYKKSIATIKRRSKLKSIVHFTVTARIKKAHGFLAHMFEFGTSKMAAKPHFRPAFENKGPEALDAFKKYMQKRTQREIEKASKS